MRSTLLWMSSSMRADTLPERSTSFAAGPPSPALKSVASGQLCQPAAQQHRRTWTLVCARARLAEGGNRCAGNTHLPWRWQRLQWGGASLRQLLRCPSTCPAVAQPASTQRVVLACWCPQDARAAQRGACLQAPGRRPQRCHEYGGDAVADLEGFGKQLASHSNTSCVRGKPRAATQ
jgi:hypothetical protein